MPPETAVNCEVLAGDGPEPTISRASSILSYAVLLAGILTIGLALYMVVASYSPLPYWDGWLEVEHAAAGGNPLSPAWLWERDNEHRLVIPKLFLAADLYLFQSRQIFLLASIFGIQLLHLVLLSWSMRALGGWRGPLWRAGTGVAAFCLFSPMQYTNFIVGFQVCFLLPQLLATVSFVTLLLYWSKSQQQPEKPQSRFLGASILVAVGAVYCLASGNLLWPILILAALYLRLPRKAVLSYVISAVLSTGLYVYHLGGSGHHERSLSSYLVSPLTLLRYFTTFFVGSLAHQGGYLLVFVLVVGLVVAVIVLVPTLGYVRNFRVFGIQLALMIVFWGATAVITTVGRAHLGIEEAMTPRYQTVPLLFWCSVGLLLLGATFFARARRRYSFLLVQLCILAILVRGTATASRPIGEARQHGFALNAVSASLVTGVYDVAQLQEAFPIVNVMVWASGYLKAHHLSAFAGPIPSALGNPLEDVFSVGPSAECTGALESVTPIVEPRGPGLRVTGWAWDVKHQRPTSSIVITTNGIITGVGAVGGWRPDIAATHPGISSSYAGYTAYLREPRGIFVITLYAILPGSPPTACSFAMK